jgi:glycolate oxidase FAD binding subunit
VLGLAGDELIEWHGAQRWLVTSLPAASVATRRRRPAAMPPSSAARDKSAGVFAPCRRRWRKSMNV